MMAAYIEEQTLALIDIFDDYAPLPPAKMVELTLRVRNRVETIVFDAGSTNKPADDAYAARLEQTREQLLAKIREVIG